MTGKGGKGLRMECWDRCDNTLPNSLVGLLDTVDREEEEEEEEENEKDEFYLIFSDFGKSDVDW